MHGLYIHIPFCKKKCKYCDFQSFSGCEKDFSAYLDALTDEMSEYKGEKVDSVFIGGGTPTLLDAESLNILLRAISSNFILAENTEFTIESNPKTLTPEKLSVLKGCGVNRLSIGVQSFNDTELSAIGRIHNAEAAAAAFKMARECGFGNINLDIMFSLPKQTRESFEKTLNEVIELNPEHISCYSLILEEGTPLFDEVQSGKVSLPDDETDRKNYELACEKLKNAGYIQYEISNFASTGFECRHNIKYWDCDEYIGLGVSAHSYYKGKRFSNTLSLTEYLKGSYRSGEKDVLTDRDKISEFMIMGFRKTKGIKKDEFKKRFGRELKDVFGSETEKFKKAGLMAENGEYIYLTPEGVNVSNSILCEFV